MRDALLDVVLAWGTLDGAISQLYVAIQGKPELENADDASDTPAWKKLRAIAQVAKPHAPKLAAAVTRLKKQYERYSKTRDRVAHTHCRGTSPSSPEWALFLAYRRHEDGFVADWVHISEFHEAVRFGRHLLAICQRLTSRFLGSS